MTSYNLLILILSYFISSRLFFRPLENSRSIFESSVVLTAAVTFDNRNGNSLNDLTDSDVEAKATIQYQENVMVGWLKNLLY